MTFPRCVDTLVIVSGNTDLTQELSFFEKIKDQLLENHQGKFALIKDDEFIGAFDTPANAYEEGVRRFGRSIFLVKKISEKEEVYRNQALSLGIINARL